MNAETENAAWAAPSCAAKTRLRTLVGRARLNEGHGGDITESAACADERHAGEADRQDRAAPSSRRIRRSKAGLRYCTRPTLPMTNQSPGRTYRRTYCWRISRRDEPARQRMNSAVARNWQVAAAQTKEWKTS